MIEINGHPGYFITPTGVVISRQQNKPRVLKPQKNGKGYLRVFLGYGVPRFIHRLVALHYLPNPDNKPEVNHINEDKTNNHLFNLEWCDSAHNAEWSKAKWWDILTPTGDIIQVHNIKKWCGDNGVNRGNLTARGYSGGYKLVCLI